MLKHPSNCLQSTTSNNFQISRTERSEQYIHALAKGVLMHLSDSLYQVINSFLPNDDQEAFVDSVDQHQTEQNVQSDL